MQCICICTAEALSGMVFAPAQKLSGIEWTQAWGRTRMYLSKHCRNQRCLAFILRLFLTFTSDVIPYELKSCGGRKEREKWGALQISIFFWKPSFICSSHKLPANRAGKRENNWRTDNLTNNRRLFNCDNRRIETHQSLITSLHSQ